MQTWRGLIFNKQKSRRSCEFLPGLVRADHAVAVAVCDVDPVVQPPLQTVAAVLLVAFFQGVEEGCWKTLTVLPVVDRVVLPEESVLSL